MRRCLQAVFLSVVFLTACGPANTSSALGPASAFAVAGTNRIADLHRNVRTAIPPAAAAKYIYVGGAYPFLAVYDAVSGKLEASLPNHSEVFAAATNSAGNVYASQHNHAISAWTPSLKTIPPTIKMADPALLAVGGNGNIYVATVTYKQGSEIHTYTPEGAPTTPTISNVQAYGLAVDASNKIYALTSPQNGQNITVSTYLSDGTPTTPTIEIAGCYPASQSNALAVDLSGKIYVAAFCHSINFNGVLTFTPDGKRTTPTISPQNGCYGVTVDATGKIYMNGYVDNSANITTYLPDGTQTTPTISGLGSLRAIAVF